MWLHHLWNLFGRSWSAMVAAIGTTTLGFVLWTLLFTALGWFVGVVATWIKLRNRKIPHPFKEALRDSLLSGALSATTVLVILVGSYVIFFIRTVYLDHQSLVSQVATLNRSNAELTKELEIRNHSMVTNQPVFTNTIYLLMAFDMYRHAQKGKPCVLMITAPHDSNPMASMVAHFSNSVSDCMMFGPMDPEAEPDAEKRASDGMIPDKIVFHAARDDKAADSLFNSLGGLIQLKRSYDLPSAAERTHIYALPNPGHEDLIWLQFGNNVKWNEQLH